LFFERKTQEKHRLIYSLKGFQIMAIINVIGISNAQFDTVSRQLTIDCSGADYDAIPATPANGEEVALGFLLSMEGNISASRTDLDAPISPGDSFSVPNPQYQFVLRQNADETASELQIEYTPNIRLWFKDAGAISASNAVNNAD
jgi:hypothetical protein